MLIGSAEASTEPAPGSQPEGMLSDAPETVKAAEEAAGTLNVV